MGNYNSCIKSQSTNSKVAKLVDSQGQVRLLNLPTTVAEIMLENPGFTISPVDALLQTRRVPVMKADDMLQCRQVYLLVPVDKVNSRLSNLQLAAIDSLVCSRRRTRGSSQVSPVIETGSSLEDLVKGLSDKCTGLAGRRSGCYSKGWEPVLEPILEIC